LTDEVSQRFSISVSKSDRNKIKTLAKGYGVKMYEMITIMVNATESDDPKILEMISSIAENKKRLRERKSLLRSRLDDMTPEQIESLLKASE
jgi:hypothetical protein